MSSALLYRTVRFLPVSVVRDDFTTRPCTDTPESAMIFWHEVIARDPAHDPSKEHLVVIVLNTRLRPTGWSLISLGSANETIAHPRDILRPVIAANAPSFILMHNHPSGDPMPSRADRTLTKRIAEAADLMQINIIDHIIAGTPSPLRDAYFSFQESGLL